MQSRGDAISWNPESTAAFWINRAARSLVRGFDGRLRPFGFAMSHLPVLRALADGRSLSQRELVELGGVEQPTMAEMLARMERDGVVLREPNPDDRRATKVSLTHKARARIPKAKAALLEGEREAMRGMNAVEKTLLRELLQRVVRNLESRTPGEMDGRRQSDRSGGAASSSRGRR